MLQGMGRGGKVSRSSPTPRNHSSLPRPLKHTRTLILNFGSDVLRTPIFFFFPVGRLVQYLQRLLPQGGSLVAVRRSGPGFRLMHVLNPVQSHRPGHLFGFSFRGERTSENSTARSVQVQAGTSALNSSLPGIRSPPNPASEFPPASGECFCFPPTPQNEGALGGERKWLRGTVALGGRSRECVL